MKFNTWLEAIRFRDFGEEVEEMMIVGASNTRIVGEIPDELAFFKGGFVSLGFDRIEVPEEEKGKIQLAFVGTGVAVPDTVFRLRHDKPGYTFVEKVEGTEEATLPINWKQFVVVTDYGKGSSYLWIGKKVPGFDLTNHTVDGGDGWQLGLGGEKPS